MKKNLPEQYMGFKVEKLLKTLYEIQHGGTNTSQRKIRAMSKLLREYKLTPVHKITIRTQTTFK